MKIPSLSRIPNHKRFNFEPRYYDPVKEDLKERTARIKQEISQLDGAQMNYRSVIEGSFSKRANRTKNANTLQLVIMIFLITVLGGYLLYGNDIFYVFLCFIPLYLYFRLKRFSKRR